MSGSPNLEFIIIGGGLQGFGAGLALLAGGHKVTILEMKEAAGQVVSRRSPLMQHGGGHTGMLFLDKTALRSQYCDVMNLAVDDPSRLNSLALQIHLANSDTVGKNLIAWTDDGCRMIHKLHDLGKSSPVYNIVKPDFRFGDSEISALDEPLFAKRLPQGVMHLPFVRIFRLPAIVRELEAEFIHRGGEVLYSHEATNFAAGSANYTGEKGTGVVCKVNGQEKTFYADVAINMAGMHAAHVAEMSKHPITRFENGYMQGYSVVEPLVPNDPHFHYYGMLVPGRGTPEAELVAKSLTYSADLIPDDGNKLGLHAYLGRRQGAGWSIVLGTIRHIMDSREALARATQNDLTFVPPESISDMHQLLPWGVDPGNFVQVEAGRVGVFYHKEGANDPRRDFYPSVSAIPIANYRVLNAITGDTPGGFGAPAVAEIVARAGVILAVQAPANANHLLRNPRLALAA